MIIRKGTHKPFRLPKFYWKKKVMEYDAVFSASCRYEIQDQSSINKLFGIGYLWSLHDDSARVGWRYNIDTYKIELLAYCYVNGQRLSSAAKEYLLDDTMTCWCKRRITLEITRTEYLFYVQGVLKARIYKTHNKKIGYRLNPYFGGKSKAPHNISITLTKIK